MQDRPTLSDRLRAAPLARALVPMVAGIVLGTLVPAALHVWIICTAVCAVTAAALIFSGIQGTQRGSPERPARAVRLAPGLYAGLAILFFGAAAARAHAPRQVVPQEERVWLEMRLTSAPVHREGRRSASVEGIAGRWRTENGEWRAAGEKLLVSIDTVWRFGAGDRVLFRGYVNPVGDGADSYSRLMWARGFVGRTYISRYSHPEVVATGERAPRAWARKLQSAATERLGRLGTGDGISVAAAMTTGDRTGITPGLRRAYSRTGASHLLAVSGLHVGIVFLTINVLLYLLPLFPRGHIVKNIVAIAAVWLYAALTGLSPSATRAAFMFTGAQFALATSQTRGSVNIMCGTAMVMLAVKPGLLMDISFQLSFIAVAAIMAWFPPLYRLVASRWRLLNALWATLLVGFTASLATMPLVSYTFGVFSPAGIVLNPIVIATAHLIVGSSLLWIAAPAPFLEPFFRLLVGGAAGLQNRVVELVSTVPGAAVEWTMPLWAVFAVYGAMIIFTVWFASRERAIEPFVLPR